MGSTIQTCTTFIVAFISAYSLFFVYSLQNGQNSNNQNGILANLYVNQESIVTSYPSVSVSSNMKSIVQEQVPSNAKDLSITTDTIDKKDAKKEIVPPPVKEEVKAATIKRIYIDDNDNLFDSPGYMTSNRIVNDLGDNLFEVHRSCFDISKNKLYIINSKGKIDGCHWMKCAFDFKFISMSSVNLFNQNRTIYSFDGDNVLLLMTTFQKHMTHFIEIFNYVLYYMHEYSRLPKINYLINPLYDSTQELSWINNYYDIVTEELTRQFPILLMNAKEFAPYKDGLVCFKKLDVIGRITTYGIDGNNFLSREDAQMIRVLVYKKLGLSLNVPANRRLHTLFIYREPAKYHTSSRLISNFEEIKSTLNRHKDLIVQYTNFEAPSFKDQITIVSDTDIMITPCGAALTNMIFMLPHSALVVLNEPWYGSLRFAELAPFSDIYYYPVMNLERKSLPPKCSIRYFNIMNNWADNGVCSYAVHYVEKYTVNVLHMMFMVNHARTAVQINKYHNL
ncbi:hypothetical protein WA158_001946 [Blastocystis sp. Blastoise]